MVRPCHKAFNIATDEKIVPNKCDKEMFYGTN